MPPSLLLLPGQRREQSLLSRQKILLLISFAAVAFYLSLQLWAVSIVTAARRETTLENNLRFPPNNSHVKRHSKPAALQFSPACHPHYRVAITSDTIGNTTWSTSLPFTRIYFYHVRKAGGTMLRKFLKKVALTHNIHLEIQENKYAREKVGSHPGTMYVTNLRDPVERSISHFKYEGRWDCRQIIKNATHYTPTLQNAKKFEAFFRKICALSGLQKSALRTSPLKFDESVTI